MELESLNSTFVTVILLGFSLCGHGLHQHLARLSKLSLLGKPLPQASSSIQGCLSRTKNPQGALFPPLFQAVSSLKENGQGKGTSARAGRSQELSSFQLVFEGPQQKMKMEKS